MLGHGEEWPNNHGQHGWQWSVIDSDHGMSHWSIIVDNDQKRDSQVMIHELFCNIFHFHSTTAVGCLPMFTMCFSCRNAETLSIKSILMSESTYAMYARLRAVLRFAVTREEQGQQGQQGSQAELDTPRKPSRGARNRDKIFECHPLSKGFEPPCWCSHHSWDATWWWYPKKHLWKWSFLHETTWDIMRPHFLGGYTFDHRITLQIA